MGGGWRGGGGGGGGGGGWRRGRGLKVCQAAAGYDKGTFFLSHTASAAVHTDYKQEEAGGEERVSFILKQETGEETDTRDGFVNMRLALSWV